MRRLIGGLILLFAAACAGPALAPEQPANPDASLVSDAGATDSGSADDDAGLLDAGSLDAGLPGDAGLQDDAGDDAGMEPDAGSAMDAGTRPDAGRDSDAGAATDAGGAVDAGSARDAGTSPDAGTADAGNGHDAGSSVDAGGTHDAGGSGDAGASDDAGSSDDGGQPDDAGPAPDAGTADAGGAGDAGITQICGDGIIEGTEQCDLGPLNGTGVGCNSMCQFDCTTSAMCADNNTCNGTETCVNAVVLGEMVMKCQAGTDEAKCTVCSGGFCNGTGTCATSTCGDGCVDPNDNEQCDWGTTNNIAGSGCQPNCTFSCTLSPDSCVTTNTCAGLETCNTVEGPNDTPGQACDTGTPPDAGTPCGTGMMVCENLMCVAPAVCGNGIVETGEQCDLGARNGTGVGCTSECTFDCENDAACSDGNVCNGAETCVASMLMGETVQNCVAGTDAASCTACATGFCNGFGKCDASVCGDGCIDPSKGEQCDDGNLFDLDGCNSTCQYEVVDRMTTIEIEGGAAPAFCTPTTNLFGSKVMTSTALSQLNPDLATDVNAGTTNVLTQFLGLTSLEGVTSSTFQLGVLTGELDPNKGTWPGNNPIDWWFLADASSVSMGLPTGLLSATLAAGKLNAGPDDVTMSLALGGSPAILRMREAQIAADISTTPAPDVPAPPPAALAPGLTVFQTITGDGTGQGLCGNITVESLAQIPIPQVLTTGDTTCDGSCAGSHAYTYCGMNTAVGAGCNSLLDVVVGGCSVKALGIICVAVINAEQPDVPATAGGHVTALTLGAGNKVPASQSTGDDDGYSSYLKIDANRTHFTGQTCSVTSDCQTGQVCAAGSCI